MVIISTPDTSVFESIEYKNHPKVILHQRSTQSAKLNQPLDFTVAEVLEDMDKEFLQSIFGVLLLDIQFPLLASEKIEDAVNTMIVFKADSLVSVRAESSSFYVHNGAGMNSIFDNDKKSKVEREILYKHVGGIIATTLESFNKNEKILNGKIGHMLLDKSSSYKVENRDDIHIVESINEIYHIL
jgi:CMP-N-acetylneuraminic acid synthetase